MSSDGYWRVQPAWVKALTVCFGLPALVVLVADVGGRFETIALVAFGIVAAIQAAVVFRAFWRIDL